jgi:hypothetical protein
MLFGVRLLLLLWLLLLAVLVGTVAVRSAVEVVQLLQLDLLEGLLRALQVRVRVVARRRLQPGSKSLKK